MTKYDFTYILRKKKMSIPPEQVKQISTKSPPVQYIILYSMIHMM